MLTQSYLCTNRLLGCVQTSNGDGSPNSPGCPTELVELRRLNEFAFKLCKDCFLFSAIAYIQLDQFEQALRITEQLQDALNDADVDDRVHVFVIKAKALQLLGRETEAIDSLRNAQ